MFHTLQCSIQHIPVMNGTLFRMEQVHSGIIGVIDMLNLSNKTALRWTSQNFNIGSGNGLVMSDSKPFITWADVDLDFLHHMASPGHNALIS